MRCANCGNEDESTLWDEGDTFYCSVCTHRTRYEDNEDDLLECPYCHRMRDRKAMYCRYCNDTNWEESTAEEFESIDSLLNNMGY
jgi:DNA-directed RNA polymerase subunit RPC12/RpoP